MSQNLQVEIDSTKAEIQRLHQSAIEQDKEMKDTAARSLDATSWTKRVLNSEDMWDGNVEEDEDITVVGLMSQEELKAKKRRREEELEKEKKDKAEMDRVAKQRKKKKRAQDVNKLSFSEDIDE